MKPLEEEFGWFRAGISMAYTAHSTTDQFHRERFGTNRNRQVVADHPKR
jgi:hypothetical protein